MERENIVLSIYTATYNRKDIIYNKTLDILKLKTDKFNIWILDDCSDDGTYEKLLEINDHRLHVLKNSERCGIGKDGVMPNWYQLLELCDANFAFHLNDRDEINSEGLLKLINFLEKNPEISGGMCSSYAGCKIFKKSQDALMNVPYKGSHPTGIVFNMCEYKKIINRKSFFTKEKSYIHPHDLVLGVLAQKGNMFLYDKIWNLAEQQSFTNNKSFLYKKGTAETSWFSPDERIKEFAMFIDSLDELNFSKKIKNAKAYDIAKRYLYFCTFNYSYYVSDVGQVSHYGILPKVMSKSDLEHEMYNFITKSRRILKVHKLIKSEEQYAVMMKIYFWGIFYMKPIWNIYKKVINRKW